jgi:hypothetical protein
LISFSGHSTLRAQGLLTDQVPDIGLAGPQASDHGRIVGQRLGLYRRAFFLAEGIEDLGGVVALPTKDVHLLVARGKGLAGLTQRRAERNRAGSHHLHQRAS